MVKKLSEILRKEKIDYKLVQANITKTQFKDKRFDIVICSEVIEHVFGFLKVISEIKRISKCVYCCSENPFLNIFIFLQRKS